MILQKFKIDVILELIFIILKHFLQIIDVDRLHYLQITAVIISHKPITMEYGSFIFRTKSKITTRMNFNFDAQIFLKKIPTE